MTKTRVILIIISILLVISTIIGVSYAIWMVSRQQTDDNLVNTGCFNIDFIENSEAINLNGAYPIPNEFGQTSEPYSFTIENTCATTTIYDVNLEIYNDTTLEHNLIRYSMDGTQSKLITEATSTSSTLENTTSYTLAQYTTGIGGSNTHEFRMWIDEAGTLDNSQNKTVRAKIVVIARTESTQPYKEEILVGNNPVLTEGLIPISIAADGTITKANVYTEWYDYETKQWANAAIVNDPDLLTAEGGTKIDLVNIIQMYVWIPRYYYDPLTIVSADKSIYIKFTETDKEAHPAFCWGNNCQDDRNHPDNIELNGLWFGKFEFTNNYKMVPNQLTLTNQNISTYFYGVKSIENNYGLNGDSDIHIIKNTDWGVVAYLSQSKYGVCKDDSICTSDSNENLRVGNSNYMTTGCGGISSTSGQTCPEEQQWTTNIGVTSSTNHNITGIYDMSNGYSEWTMGNNKYNGIGFNTASSGFTTEPEKKYYDLYEKASGHGYNDYSIMIPGDAILELNPIYITSPHWNNANIASFNNIWMQRGGGNIWNGGTSTGQAIVSVTTRAVLTPLI